MQTSTATCDGAVDDILIQTDVILFLSGTVLGGRRSSARFLFGRLEPSIPTTKEANVLVGFFLDGKSSTARTLARLRL